MSTEFWIILGAEILCAGLYIFGFIKKISLICKITGALLMPLAGALTFFALLQYLPDSRHLIQYTAAAFAAISLSELLFILSGENKILSGAGCVLFLLSTAVWCQLNFSTFYIHRPASFSYIIAGILAAALIIAVLIITGRKNPRGIAATTVALGIPSLLIYEAAVSFCLEKRPYTTPVLLGAVALLAVEVFYIITKSGKTRLSARKAQLISTSLLFLAEALLAAGAILMQA